MKTSVTRPIKWTALVLLVISCGDSTTPADPQPPTPPTLTVTVTPTEVTFAAVDDTVRLSAEVRNQAGEVVTNASVGWTSRNSLVARVDASGLVMARSSGTTTIRARSGSASAEAQVTVSQVATGMGIRPSSLELRRIGGTAQLVAHFTDANGHSIPGTISAVWSIADTVVATVNSTGLVTAASNGSTSITAEADSFAALVSVTVSDPAVDREALERLYHATGGDDWTNNAGWLTASPLSEWFGVSVGPNGRVDRLALSNNGLSGPLPPELGNLDNLTGLWLGDNQLTGPLPPEIGKLSLLERLSLIRNEVSGPIPAEIGGLVSMRILTLDQNNFSGPLPPEIGNLRGMERLGLTWNAGLKGLLPRGLLRMKDLSSFYAYATDLCPPTDDEFRQWLDGIADFGVNDCDAEQVERLVLSEFFQLTGGESWYDATGWNTDADVGTWYGITSEGGRVRSISLGNNGLSGPLPRNVSGLARLVTLDLGNNDLAGAFPADFGAMAELMTLKLNGNAGLEGYLPFEVTYLTRLDVLQYENTGLCMPPTRAFETWRQGVDMVDGAECENVEEVRVAMPVVYLTQAIQRPAGDVPLIAGRDALLRVFLTGDAPNAFYEPEVVARFSREGEEVHRVAIAPSETVLPIVVDEGDVSRSYNAVVPGDHIQPGLEFVIEADPDGVVPLADGSEIRFPASGAAALDVVEVPPMRLTVVPVVEAAAPDLSVHDWTDGVADDSWHVGLLRYAFPFSEFRARSRETYATSLNLTSEEGQWRLVLELEALRTLENDSTYWCGAASSVSGYVRGVARLGGPVSMGKPTVAELAHEIGHNLNLLHAPCGGPFRTDPAFPHRGGGIGAWGYDFRDGTVVSPEDRRDIMGYCYAQGWLSDYFFEKVISHRDSIGADAQLAATRSQPDLLVLWGGVLDGQLRIEPAIRATSTERLPDGPGPYRIEGVAGGTVEFSIPFTPGEDQWGNKYFLFMIPSGPLDRITLTGPEGTVTLGADDERTISIVRDAASGRILGILNDWTGELPAAVGQIDDIEVATYGALGERRR